VIARLDQVVQTRTPVPGASDHVKMRDPLTGLRSLSLVSCGQGSAQAQRPGVCCSQQEPDAGA